MEPWQDRNGPLVLVVEDAEASRRLLESVFGKLRNATVLSAGDGRTALELAREHVPDLVVLDLHLPDADGDEILRRLRGDELTAAIPALVVTAHATSEGRRRAFDPGATDVLTKPIDVGRTLEVAGRLLDQARSTGEVAADPAPDPIATLEALYRASPLAIIAIDSAARVTMWNAAAERVLGWRADEVLGGPLPHLTTHEMASLHGVLERLAEGEPVIDEQVTRHRKDGTPIELRTSYANVTSDTGEVVGVMSMAQDVGEQRRAEGDLHRSREALSYALKAASMGAWERTADDVNPVWSPELEQLYGLEPGSFGGRHQDFLTLVHEEDRERVDSAIRHAKATGGDMVFEFRAVRPDGQVRWFLSRGARVEDDSSSGTWLGVTTDITEQKLTQEELEAAEERFRTLVEQIPAITYVDTADEVRPIYVSPQVEDLFGISRDEWLATPDLSLWLELVDATDRERVRVATARCAEKGTPIDLEYRVVSRDGCARWFHEMARRIPGRDGEPATIHGVMLDVTAVKEAQEETRGANELFESIVRTSPVAIVASDVEGRVTLWNDAAQTTFGWTAEDVLWRNLSMVKPEELERARIYRDRVLAGESFSGVQMRRLHKDGHEIVVSVSAAPRRDLRGEVVGIIGIVLDVTERERASAELERSFDLLRSTDDQRRLLLGKLVRAQEEERRRIATHIHDDSVQVLTALTLRLDLLRSRIDEEELRATLDDAVETSRRAVTRLRHLIYDLHPPALDRDGLTAALRIFVADLRAEHLLDIELQDHLQSEPDPALRAILYRIAQEALVNVGKHARATSVVVTLGETEDGYSVAVADDGVGFDLGGIEPLDRPAGHIGLSSMRERAEMAGGSLSVRSVPNRGTTVEARLPRALAT